jgi:hypothetical protein
MQSHLRGAEQIVIQSWSQDALMNNQEHSLSLMRHGLSQ